MAREPPDGEEARHITRRRGGGGPVFDANDLDVGIAADRAEAAAEIADGLEDDALPAHVEEPRDVGLVGAQQLLDRAVHRLDLAPLD
eukprot:1137472-Rhodomonas_salina.2